MARSVAEDERAIPFPATVPRHLNEWVEEHVGPGKRWPHRSALLMDCLQIMKEIEDRVAPLAKAVREQVLTDLLESLAARRKPDGKEPWRRSA